MWVVTCDRRCFLLKTWTAREWWDMLVLWTKRAKLSSSLGIVQLHRAESVLVSRARRQELHMGNKDLQSCLSVGIYLPSGVELFCDLPVHAIGKADKWLYLTRQACPDCNWITLSGSRVTRVSLWGAGLDSVIYYFSVFKCCWAANWGATHSSETSIPKE